MSKSRFMSLLVLTALTMFVAAAVPAHAQSGTISLNSVSCPPDTNSLGSAFLSWSVDASAPDNVVVWVYNYNGNFVPQSSGLFAAQRSGSFVQAPWLQKGHSYNFVLYDGADSSGNPGNFLSSVSVQCQQLLKPNKLRQHGSRRAACQDLMNSSGLNCQAIHLSDHSTSLETSCRRACG